LTPLVWVQQSHLFTLVRTHAPPYIRTPHVYRQTYNYTQTQRPCPSRYHRKPHNVHYCTARMRHVSCDSQESNPRPAARSPGEQTILAVARSS
jgi:hypothetical protein